MKSIDASRIIPHLAIGSVPPSGDLLREYGVGVLVLAAKEAQPASREFPGVEVIHAPYADRFFEPLAAATSKRVVQVAKLVAERVKAGQNVLVTCMMGLNRSGLIAGLALRFLGMSGREAVDQIRLNRAGALSNPTFRRMVLEFEP